jgi:hypothetical protein
MPGPPIRCPNLNQRPDHGRCSISCQGLWALGRNGKVWTAGDAVPYGDVQEDPQIATGIVATPSGNGYYIVMEDGGIFAFGDAVFFGSTGGSRPGGFHITGIALSIGEDGSVNGYWLVNEDGGVLAFGGVSRWVISGGKNGEESVLASRRGPRHLYLRPGALLGQRRHHRLEGHQHRQPWGWRRCAAWRLSARCKLEPC